MQRLKDKQYYIDLYDKLTVEDCRRCEKFHKNFFPSKKLLNGHPPDTFKPFNEVTLYFALSARVAGWHNERENKIREWMDRDEKKDKFYNSVDAPQLIRCLKCNSVTTLGSKILVDYEDDKVDRVLFMYDCPNECSPRRAIYNNGQEYVSKPILCVKCNSEVERDHKRKGQKITTIDTCSSCGHTETDEMILGETKEELPDPEYEKDKARFCYPGELLDRSLEEVRQWKAIGEMVDGWKEKEINKVEYEKIEKLKKLSIPQVKQHIVESLKDEVYSNLVFEQPQMGQVVSVSFTLEDPTTQGDYESRTKLSKILKKSLAETNWRVMSDGISYRLGILSGRVRVHENERDLLRLVKED